MQRATVILIVSLMQSVLRITPTSTSRTGALPAAGERERERERDREREREREGGREREIEREREI